MASTRASQFSKFISSNKYSLLCQIQQVISKLGDCFSTATLCRVTES